MVRDRAEELQRARQAAKEDLRPIVKAWNYAFSLKAFFAELTRRAETFKLKAARASKLAFGARASEWEDKKQSIGFFLGLHRANVRAPGL
jgi:hypothetical protein